jgi:hypothetical protein
VLTLFSIPKAFKGHVGEIQVNAIRSWRALPDVQVLLVGDEAGVRDAAAELGVEHLGGVSVSDRGTPRLNDAFRLVERAATAPLRCFVNADVALLDDFVPAVAAVRLASVSFLIIGKTIDVEVDAGLMLDERPARDRLAADARREGRSRGATAIDYFVYTPGLFDPMPGFVVGRARFDNWLVWKGRHEGIVVDATDAILGVHQHHDYGHVPGGQDEAHFGEEAARNFELAGGKNHLFTIYDASHRLDRQLRLRRNLTATFRARENARKLTWKIRRG